MISLFYKKCKGCKKRKKEVDYYEIEDSDNNVVIFKGNLCHQCLITIIKSAKSVTHYANK